MRFLANLGISARRWIRKRPSLNSMFLILKSTIMEFNEDGCPHMAAGIAFFIFFSIFPILLILISIAGFRLSSPEVIASVQRHLSELLPAGQLDFIMENVNAVARARSGTGLIGLLVLFWSGRGMFLAMEFSLNKAWGNAPSRTFMGRNVIAILLIVLIGLILVLTVGLSSFLAYMTRIQVPVLNIPLETMEVIQRIIQWGVTTLLIFIIFAVLYKVLPHSRITFRSVIPGAVFATILWKIAEFGYIWYISNMARFAELYGSIGSIIGVLLWLYVASLVFLLGAEFNISYLRRKNAQSRDSGGQ